MYGPDVALETYQAQYWYAAYESTGYWWRATDQTIENHLERIPADRSNTRQGPQQQQQQRDSSAFSGNHRLIIDRVVGEDDRCTDCDARKGVDLWNETSEQPTYPPFPPSLIID